MNWIPVSSSNVAAIAYNESEHAIYVRFINYGSWGKYLNCSKGEFEQFLNSPSKGQFIHHYLKLHHQWVKMG